MAKWQRVATSLATGLILLMPAGAWANEADLQRRLNAGEVVVRSQLRPRGGVIDASIVVPATLAEVYTLLADPEQMPRYSRDIVAVRVLEDAGTRKRVWTQARQFGVLAESEMDSTYRPYDLITWRQVKGRLAAQSGEWRVNSRGQGTLLTYHLEVDVGSAVPPAIVNAFLKTTVPSMLRNIRQLFVSAPK